MSLAKIIIKIIAAILAVLFLIALLIFILVTDLGGLQSSKLKDGDARRAQKIEAIRKDKNN